jgi:RecJ-like exonuclease
MKFRPDAAITLGQDCNACNKTGIIAEESTCTVCHRHYGQDEGELDVNEPNLPCGHAWDRLISRPVFCGECEGSGIQTLSISLQELKDWILSAEGGK